MARSPQPDDILNFWFGLTDKVLFTADPKFDAQLTRRFSPALDAALKGKLDHWAETPEGALALLLLLDQMSRNIRRGSSAMYEGDTKAREIADRALARRDDTRFSKMKRRWFYMPFMHSERLTDQDRCVELCRKGELKRVIKHAEQHAEIIRRFGRFPHRNAILGRPSTEAELAYLASGGFKG